MVKSALMPTPPKKSARKTREKLDVRIVLQVNKTRADQYWDAANSAGIDLSEWMRSVLDAAIAARQQKPE